ncbi:MAG: MoaD/ThiS family protein, partial [bacterium]
ELGSDQARLRRERLQDVLARLAVGASVTAGGVAVAVNGEIIRADPVLHDGDEVALLPPVSGG